MAKEGFNSPHWDRVDCGPPIPRDGGNVPLWTSCKTIVTTLIGLAPAALRTAWNHRSPVKGAAVHYRTN